MVGYLMNIAFPRMGEISRCGVLSRYENISFTKLVGTVVVERLIDVIVLLLLTFLVIANPVWACFKLYTQQSGDRGKTATNNCFALSVHFTSCHGCFLFSLQKSI